MYVVSGEHKTKDCCEPEARLFGLEMSHARVPVRTGAVMCGHVRAAAFMHAGLMRPSGVLQAFLCVLMRSYRPKNISYPRLY